MTKFRAPLALLASAAALVLSSAMTPAMAEYWYRRGSIAYSFETGDLPEPPKLTGAPAKPQPGPSGMGGGKVHMQDIHFTTRVDKHSPMIPGKRSTLRAK
jgi:hypothetical protein